MGNAYAAEGEYGYRNHYHHYNRTLGDGYEMPTTQYEFGNYRYNYHPKHLDWWNHLEKDQHDGMRSTGVTFSDYVVGNDGSLSKKDYMKEAEKIIREKEAAEAAAAGKSKISNEDKAVAKELGGLAKEVDSGETKKPAEARKVPKEKPAEKGTIEPTKEKVGGPGSTAPAEPAQPAAQPPAAASGPSGP